MTERYLVRCTSSDPAQPMSGIYAARLTITGMVATWKRERAAQYDRLAEASLVVARLANKFRGTQWAAEPVLGE
jgi:hypothetical protein